MEDLRYPVGRFARSEEVRHSERAGLIDNIAAAPGLLRNAVADLSDDQLDTAYRPGGWTVRQVVHHLPDSHMNAFIRFKLALTEDNPTIKTYDENSWAKLPDVETTRIEVSLDLLTSLHARWVILLRSLEESDFDRALQHPENGEMTLGMLLRMYEWHGRHHVAHITNLRRRMGWS